MNKWLPNTSQLAKWISEHTRSLVVRAALTACLLSCGVLVSLYLLRPWVSPQVESFSIDTPPLASLPPHEHTLGESLFDPGHGKSATSTYYIVQKDMWVTDISVHVNGAPHDILHHLLVYEIGPPRVECPGTTAMIGIFGTESPPTVHFPTPYGVFLPKGTRLFVGAMLHNPEPPEGRGDTYRSVSAGVTITGQTDHTNRSRMLSFHELPLTDTGNCVVGTIIPTFMVPARAHNYIKTSTTTLPSFHQETFTAPSDGIVLNFLIHAHPWDGATKGDLLLNAKEKGTFTWSRNTSDPFLWQVNGPHPLMEVAKGSRVSLSVTYTNETAVPLRDAMGIGAFYYWPTTHANILTDVWIPALLERIYGN